MQFGLIGLGRIGGTMVRRLAKTDEQINLQNFGTYIELNSSV